PRDLHGLGRRLLAQSVTEGLCDLQCLRQEQLRLRTAVLAGRQCQQDALLRLRAEPLQLPEALALSRFLQVVERGDPQLVEEPARTLGPESRQPRDLDEAGRIFRLQLL